MGLFDGTPIQRPVTCERCGKAVAKQTGGNVGGGASAEEICACPRDAGGRVSMPKDQPARVRREKRRGNWNTVVSGLALGDAKSLVKTLRSRLGAGGTVDDNGELVLQGDHKDAVLGHLIELGYAAKGAGG